MFTNILKENSKFLFFIEPNWKQYYFLAYLVKGTSHTYYYALNKMIRRLRFLLIYCKETQKTNTLLSQMKKELTSYLLSEEKHINLKI